MLGGGEAVVATLVTLTRVLRKNIFKDLLRVAALIKRWLLGTHRGSVQPKHLDAYLDGFVFRFNRRKSAFRN